MSESSITTAAGVARALGVSERTFFRWVGAGCPKANGDGVYDMAAIVQWRDLNIGEPDHDELSEALPGVGAVGRKREAEARLVEEKLVRIRMENAARKGELVHVAEAQQEAAEIFLVFKSRVLEIPDKMAVELPKAQRAKATRRLGHHCRLMLRGLAQLRVGGAGGEDLVIAAADAIRSKREADAKRDADDGD